MEVDIGASLSVINEKTFGALWGGEGKLQLKETSVVLQTYTGEKVKPKGEVEVKVAHNGQETQLPLLVVEGGGQPLIGRNWLEKLRLNWTQIKQLTHVEKELDEVLRKYTSLFEEGLGTLKGTKAKIYVEANTKPELHKARPVPYALREKIEQELERLVGYAHSSSTQNGRIAEDLWRLQTYS